MKEMPRAFKAIIIILTEPRISGEAANKVCKILGRAGGSGRKQRGLVGGFGYYGRRGKLR